MLCIVNVQEVPWKARLEPIIILSAMISFILVVSVTNVTHPRRSCVVTGMLIQANSSVRIAANVSDVREIF